MAHLTKERVEELYEEFGDLKVLDDIVRHRAADNPPAPILGYPKSENNVNEYEYFTGRQLDQFVDGAVKHYLDSGLKSNTKEVVGIFAPSNVDFVVTFFALSRLGYTVLCLSLRIPPVAIVNLLKKTKCSIITCGDTEKIAATLAEVAEEVPLKTVVAPNRSQYGKGRPSNESPFVRQFDREAETNEPCLIMHSSGSTGLPKPVSLSHANLLTHPVQGAGMNNFGALPLYHMYGLSTTLQAMYMGKIATLPSATLPMTADNLMSAIEATQPEIFHAVPYALGLLVEHPRGMAYLKSAKIVTAAGARTPDELGDRMIKESVNFGVVFGTTEAGLLGDTMGRETGDDSWNYVRIYPNNRDSIFMEPIGGNLFECVYLESHSGLSPSAANSDDPAPGSWRSKDVFAPHPSIPDVWKYITRLDDRVTLSNGEKVLPLPIEGRIRQEDLIREAVVVGVDRAMPGVLIFRAADDHLSPEDFLKAVWPAIVDANSNAESFSQITKELVTILPSDVEYPRTDKGSIIRAQCYLKFADIIDEMYKRLEGEDQGTLKLDLAGIETFLKTTYEDIVNAPLKSKEIDFFNAGIDSLKAIQMRRVIQKTLDLKGKQLSSNVVYDHGNVKTLAKYLFDLGNGVGDEDENKTLLMEELIQQYSGFGETAILTGSTGSLGAHILSQMVNNHSMRKVYCLVRGEDPLGRVMHSLEERGITLDPATEFKIVALSAEFSQPDLGLGKERIEQFKAEVSLIIHLAWPVNFSIGLQSFEPHLSGLRTLLTLSLEVHRSEPARFYFASSISTAENTPPPALIPDAPIDDFSHALNMGYAQSKLVGEHMILNAARGGARSYVLRIGQIVGDLKTGAWNEAEYVPSMIRAALSMKALPALEENCSWIPVDTLATAILEVDKTLQSGPRPYIKDSTSPPVIYNMVNPHTFSFDRLLEALHEAGLEFKTVPYAQWMVLLRESAVAGNVKENPAIKLLDHFEMRFNLSQGTKVNSLNGNYVHISKAVSAKVNGTGAKTNGATPHDSIVKGARKGGLEINHYLSNAGGVPSPPSSASDGSADGEETSGVTFDTKAVQRDSMVLRQPPRIIEDGYVQKFLANWLEKWVK